VASGAKAGHVSCDTQSATTSVCGTQISINNERHGDCELKLACELPHLPAGPVTLQVTGTVGAGTSDVKNMSINVRDK
jgi:hypothetical protein